MLISDLSDGEYGDEARLGGFRHLNRPGSFAGMTASGGGGIALSLRQGGADNGLDRGGIRSN